MTDAIGSSVFVASVVLSLLPAAAAQENQRREGVTWRTAPALVESTHDVVPQIQPAVVGATRSVPLLSPRPPALAGAAPAVPPAPPGALLARTSGPRTRNPATGFPGIGQTPWRPPDPTLAVGPSHIVETVNMQIAFFTKAGALQFTQNLDSTGSPGFFEDIGGGDFTFDPKCLYDQYSGRFVVVALEVYFDTSESYITIAVSDDSDPNGTWYKYRTDAITDIGGLDYWVDYPGLGVDEDAIYVTSNLFDFFSFSQGGTKYRIFDKAPLLMGDPASYADLVDTTSVSTQVAHEFGTAAAPFFVSASSTTTIRILAITDPLGSPALVSADVTVPAFDFPVRFSDFVPDLVNCGIDGLDGRLINAAWRDGALYTGHGIKSGSKIVARWYRFDTNDWPTSGLPTLNQSGDIDPGGNVYTWFPAIMPNDCGDVGVVLARSSSAEYAGIYCTGRRPSDPPGTMTAPLTALGVGTEGYCDFRWGDYFGIALDPSDEVTLWGIGEYAVDLYTWQTWIGSFSADAPPEFDPGTPCDETVVVLPGDTLSYTVSVSDPNAADTVTLSASGVPSGASHAPALPIVGAAPSTMFSWTPALTDAGLYTVTYSASDGKVTSECEVRIRVKSKIRKSP